MITIERKKVDLGGLVVLKAVVKIYLPHDYTTEVSELKILTDAIKIITEEIKQNETST